jgi:hypothetical protein
VDNLVSNVDAKTLNVPGARIYYEVRGAGPVLLCMPGGPAARPRLPRL